MHFVRKTISLFLILVMSLVAGCGASGGDGAATTQPKLFASSTAVPADHTAIVQQLYVSYFGRPADPGGLASFKAQLVALGGPTDIQGLDQAYRTNSGIRQLVDSFGSSAESAALYSGDNTAFITAIYRNVLNRVPDQEGLAFWAGAIDNGSLTRANASLSIMAGGLANSSEQGQLDAALINRKVVVGTGFTDKLIQAPVNAYQGDGAAARARAMLASVNAATDTAAFAPTVDALIQSLADNRTAPPPVFSFAGVYKGTYAGTDAGTFTVTLSADGTITGDGSSTLDDSDQFNVVGEVAEGGAVSLNSTGRAGSATFSGIVTSKGGFAGTWTDGDHHGGTFAGQKQ